MNTSNITTFEALARYTHGYIGDADLKTTYVVKRRTAKSIWISKIKHDGSVSNIVERKVIYVYDGTERVKPDGNYSMCPVLRADKLDAVQPAARNTAKLEIVADMAERTLNIPGEGLFSFDALGITAERVNRNTILSNVMPLVEQYSTRVHFINEKPVSVLHVV